jgi:type III pantothenate kinase
MSATSSSAPPEPATYLVIDAGNTNIAFAVYTGDERQGRWRIATDARRTADEYAVWLTQLMQLDGLDRRAVDAAIIASVVPGVTANLRRLCARYVVADPMVAGEGGIGYDIPVRLDHPEEIGADRLVNAVAAHETYGGPCIVVDFGTATTFDIVAADGGYEGGVIAPGIHASMDALYASAAKLPGVAIKRPARVIGTSTVPAIQSGVFWGYIGLIEGLIRRITAEHGGRPTVIATGGLAAMFDAETDAIDHVDDDLTLRGLLRLARRHHEGHVASSDPP